MKIIQVFYVQDQWTLKNLFDRKYCITIYGLGDDGELYVYLSEDGTWKLACGYLKSK